MDDLRGILTDFLPIILSVAGSLFAAFFGLISFFWRSHKKQTGSVLKSIDKLSEQVRELRAESHLASIKSETMRGGMLGIEGAIKSQQQTIQLHIEKIVRVETKLEAIFRYIDAPGRTTDNRR